MSAQLKYNFYYWGPLLFHTKLLPEDLKKCTDLCSKKSDHFNKQLAGVIQHEHTVEAGHYFNILLPYMSLFRKAFDQWYGQPLKKMSILNAWVNFMKPGEFNPPHIHTKCDMSSVLFNKVTPNIKKENEKFKGTGGGPGSVSFSYGESNPLALTGKSFIPEAGDFFIFPATTNHFVSPFLTKGERISTSANFKIEI